MTHDRLIPCAACGAHVRAAEPCPFCGGEGAHDGSAPRGTRGGVVAASLLALSACASPSPELPPEHDTGDEVVVETLPSPEDDEDRIVDGEPPAEELVGPPEPPPAAAYGGPPDDMIMQPMYGIAPE